MARSKKTQRSTLWTILLAVACLCAFLCFIPTAKAEKPDDVVLGIDLGTTYSCVACVFRDLPCARSYSQSGSRNGQVEIIAIEQGNRITPSFVAFTPTGERLVGDSAKNQAPQNPFSVRSLSTHRPC